MLTTPCTVCSGHDAWHVGCSIRVIAVEGLFCVEVIIARPTLKGLYLGRHLVVAMLHDIGIEMLAVETITRLIGLKTGLVDDMVVEGFDHTTVFARKIALGLTARTGSIVYV